MGFGPYNNVLGLASTEAKYFNLKIHLLSKSHCYKQLLNKNRLDICGLCSIKGDLRKHDFCFFFGSYK